MIMTVENFLKLKKKKKSKYNSVSIEKKGIKFQSKLEAEFYELILKEEKKGFVKYHLRQIPFRLPGNIKYVVDFMLIMKNDEIQYIDVKGVMTDICRLKIKQVVDLYPVKIEIVTKKDFYKYQTRE